MSLTTTPTQTPAFATTRDDRPAADDKNRAAGSRRFEMTARPTATAVTRDEPSRDVDRLEGFF